MRRGGGVLDEAAIRDASLHTTKWLRKAPGIYIFDCVNTLDQTILITFQGANDDNASKWVDLPNPLTLVATTGTGPAAVSDPHKFIRAKYQAGGVPTQGTIHIGWGAEG